MTPREKQKQFRNAIKEILGWTFMSMIPFMMIFHWLVIGY